MTIDTYPDHVLVMTATGSPWQCPIGYLPYALARGATIVDEDFDVIPDTDALLRDRLKALLGLLGTGGAPTTPGAVAAVVGKVGSISAQDIATALTSLGFGGGGDVIRALEGAPAFIYGHSFADSGGSGAVAGGHALELLFRENFTLTAVNRAAGGTRSDAILSTIRSTWIANTLGVIGLAGGHRNDQNFYGNSTPNVATVAKVFRSIFAYLTARATASYTSAAFLFGTGWTSGSTSTPGAVADFIVNGDSTFIAWSAATGTGGSFTVRNNAGTVIATVNTGGNGAPFVGVTKLTGLGAGDHVFRITVESGTVGIVGLVIPSPTPPLIVWELEPPYDPARVAGGATANTVSTQYQDATRAVAAEFDTTRIVTVTAPTDWNPATDTYEGVHPNGSGNPKIRAKAAAAIRAAGIVPVQGIKAMTLETAAAVYPAPTNPVYGGGGGDTTAPSTPGTPTATAGSPQNTLTWATSTDNIAVAGYHVYRSDAPTTVLGTSTTTSYTDTTSPLNTSVTYTVDAYDAAGNTSAKTAASNAVTATPSSDVTPPSTPGTPTATAGANQVGLTWTGSSDNVAVTGYRVYRSDAPNVVLGTTTGTTYTDTTPVVGTAYTYTVDARDAAGNASPKSAASNSATATAPVSTAFLNDTVTDNDGVLMTAHTPEVGGAYTKQSLTGDFTIIGAQGRAYLASGTALLKSAAVPPSANYTVTAGLDHLSVPAAGVSPGPVARMSGGAGYVPRYDYANARYRVDKLSNGATASTLFTFSATVAAGQHHDVGIRVGDAGAITLVLDGVDVAAGTDPSPLTAAGNVGVIASSVATTTTGVHVTSLSAA